MAVQERPRLHTLADLRRIEALPENADTTFELIEGEISAGPTPSALHNYIVAMLLVHLAMFARAHNLGMAFGDQTSYTLASGDELIPDASFITAERLPRPLPDRFALAPDLAVEVFSPSNREREITRKVEIYLANGARLVWGVYPLSQVVESYRRADDEPLTLRIARAADTLDGEAVLPGFSLPVRDFFPQD